MRRLWPLSFRFSCFPAFPGCWGSFLPRPIFPPSWPGQYWCLCSSPPSRSRPMALAATSRATPSPSRCSPRSISSARSRPPFRWRSVTSAISFPALYAALGAASHALFGLLPGVVGNLLSQIPFLSVGIPAVFSLYFDWFSSFMQAFIFCMLTMMYIAAAAEAD